MGVLLAALAFLSPASSFGAIYKCVDMSGRVLISDQQCVVNDVAPGVKEKPKASLPVVAVVASAATNKEPFQAERALILLERESLEQKIQLKHNTECRDMRTQLKKQGHFASNALHLELSVNKNDKLLEAQYQKNCLAQVKDIVVLDQAQKERMSAEKARKTICDIKTREYEKRKQQLNSTSSDLDITTLEVLQVEVKRGCR